MMSARDMWGLTKNIVHSWGEDNVPRLGAALSYYTVLSIPPLLIVLLGIAGLVVDRTAVQARVVQTIGNLAGREGAGAIQQILGNVHRDGRAFGASIVGLVLLLLSASGVFSQIKGALNTVWEVQPKPGGGIRRILAQNAVPVLILLGSGFLLVVSFVVSAALNAFGDYLGRMLPGGAGLWHAVNALFSLAVIALLFALMFEYIPDARPRWRDAWVGGIVTSVLFFVGEDVIGIYLGRSNVGSAFGAAGSLVILLVWVYYSSLIFLFGAEFTKAWAEWHGRRLRPERNARFLTEYERAQQGVPHRPREDEPARSGERAPRPPGGGR